MNGIQKQGGQKSTRRLEDAIASLHALERQSALMYTQQQLSLSPRPAAQKQEELASMRQRMAEMEKRARERAALSQSLPEGAPEAGKKKQSAEMQAAKKTMLAALTAGTTSADDLEAAVAGLTNSMADAGGDGGAGVAEATVMLGAAQTRLRRLQPA